MPSQDFLRRLKKRRFLADFKWYRRLFKWYRRFFQMFGPKALSFSRRRFKTCCFRTDLFLSDREPRSLKFGKYYLLSCIFWHRSNIILLLSLCSFLLWPNGGNSCFPNHYPKTVKLSFVNAYVQKCQTKEQ